jgi:D-hexose-6-phosphate mutarotase
MEVKYGHSETYQYNLDKERLNWLTDRTNRSNNQTQFLFQLVDGDFEKLKALEVQVKNCFVFYCPGDKEAVEEVMKMTPKSDYFKL